MNTQINLFPETLLVEVSDGKVFTTSLKVAEHFGKRHKDVLKAIQNLLADIARVESDGAILRRQTEFSQPNLGAAKTTETNFSRRNFAPANHPESEFSQPNFGLADYLDNQGKPRPMYLLSHDGFALLAMGFTGRVALAWKVRFLAAFREMERQLAALKEREANALYAIRPRWKPIVEHPGYRRVALIELTGHKSPGSITACRRRMRQVGLLH